MKPIFSRQPYLVFIATLLVTIQVGCINFSVSKGIDYPPFIQAALDGDTVETDRLLRSGEFPNQTSEIGNQTALHVA
jgi:hypothetical protein